MKKIVCIILSAVLMLGMFAGCSSSTETAATETAAPETATASPEAEATAAPEAEAAESTEDTVKSYKIAIVQQLDHSSLDEIRLAIEAELTARAEADGIVIQFDEFNGRNDATILNQIGAQVVDDNYDAIIPIATMAAQCMVTAVDDKNIPIIYAAISDPAAAGLTGLANVTGTSDALNTEFMLDMMFAVNPDIQTVGLLYSNSEINSEAAIAEAKEYLDAKGIAYLEKTGNDASEIVAAAGALVDRVDAVFTPTDNIVMASESAIAEILNEAGIPHYAGADSFVTSGAFATCGVNYTELGTYTADMTVDILLTGVVPEYHVMDGGIITVNTASAALLGIDYSVFSEMAGTVVETTGE